MMIIIIMETLFVFEYSCKSLFSKMAPTEGGLETGGIDCFAVCVPSP